MKYAQRNVETAGRFNGKHCGIPASILSPSDCSSDIHLLYFLVQMFTGEVRLIPSTYWCVFIFSFDSMLSFTIIGVVAAVLRPFFFINHYY